MKSRIILKFCGICLLTATTVFSQEKRETIFDRKVNIEKELHLEIPFVKRLCDDINLKKHFIDVGDCKLYVEEEGTGTPIVLINGGPGGTHHCFHPWFSELAKKSKVIYYDQRGCGLSEFKPGKDGYSVEQAIDDLDNIRKNLGIDKWIVLGYSYGGFLAQYYTTKYPENVSGLVLLVAATGMWVEMKDSRQNDFQSKEELEKKKKIREELSKIAKEKNWDRSKLSELSSYNQNLNGDWKRQHFYKPSKERIAQSVLYEWNQDKVFRNQIGNSQNKTDLTGAFKECPIPTLILEGKWDLTWNTDKPQILLNNHPRAKMVFFENAGHGVYDEETELFFKTLSDFVNKLQTVKASDIENYKKQVTVWKNNFLSSPAYVLRISAPGMGKKSMEVINKAYNDKWIKSFFGLFDFMKTGLALYDFKNYNEALNVFKKMQEYSKNQPDSALSMIWQAHMLDLLNKREDAIKIYKIVAEMNINDGPSFDQYGLSIKVSPYAKERIEKPFQRLENQWLD